MFKRNRNDLYAVMDLFTVETLLRIEQYVA